MASVLDLVKAAAVRLQLPVVTIAVGNDDPHVAQLLAAMSVAADDLLDRFPLNRMFPSGAWVRSTTGTLQRAPKLDTDEVLIDEALMKATMLWRWRSDNGFDYAEDFRAAEDRISRLGAKFTRENRGRMVLR